MSLLIWNDPFIFFVFMIRILQQPKRKETLVYFLMSGNLKDGMRHMHIVGQS
ncbi:hypothetical protein ACQV5M_07840 [Leptospira sp. SA-E8]|uniref:hypothetical protein n=1 Tax=Leptospira sp. SA-E8 TaxID=3422259 RepID=UPI003EBC71D2